MTGVREVGQEARPVANLLPNLLPNREKLWVSAAHSGARNLEM